MRSTPSEPFDCFERAGAECACSSRTRAFPKRCGHLLGKACDALRPKWSARSRRRWMRGSSSACWSSARTDAGAVEGLRAALFERADALCRAAGADVVVCRSASVRCDQLACHRATALSGVRPLLGQHGRRWPDTGQKLSPELEALGFQPRRFSPGGIVQRAWRVTAGALLRHAACRAGRPTPMPRGHV